MRLGVFIEHWDLLVHYHFARWLFWIGYLLWKIFPRKYIRSSWWMSVSCVITYQATEDVPHLFLHCPLARQVWDYLLRLFAVNLAFPYYLMLLDHWQFGFPKTRLIVYGVVVVHYWLLFVYWLERNRIVIQDKLDSSKVGRRLVRELFFGSWQGMNLLAGAVGFIIVASISDALGFYLPHFCFLFILLSFLQCFLLIQ